MNKKEIRKYLNENYDIGNIHKITSISGKTNNQNFIIQSAGGKFVLHILQEKIEHKQIEKICNILYFCKNKKSKVPEPIKTVKGKYSIKNNSIYLTKFDSGASFSRTEKEMKSFSKNLAILHKSMKSCKITYAHNPNKEFYKLLKNHDILKIKKKIKQKSTKDQFDNYLLDNFPKIEISLKQLLKLKSEKQYKKQLIHNDLHPENILFKNCNVVSIMDFNSLKMGYAIEDIAFSSFRFAIILDDKKELKNHIVVFVKQYKKYNNIAISYDDIRFYLIQRILQGISYIIKKRYFDNENIWIYDLKKYFRFLLLAIALEF